MVVSMLLQLQLPLQALLPQLQLRHRRVSLVSVSFLHFHLFPRLPSGLAAAQV